ncbi:MAG: ATP-binding protein [Capsulimonas sp.]|uniref:sensor histidine kinase n=1 Tax=Capsulimonas sp. TaxID=2494211 RepID=UPI00326350BA
MRKAPPFPFSQWLQPKRSPDEADLAAPTAAIDVCPVDESARWKAVMASTDDAILLVDASSHILLKNPVASRLFSKASQTEKNRSERLSETLFGFTLSRELDDLFRKSHDRAVVVEAEITLTQSVSRSLHTRVAPVSSDEFLIVMRDLTELRRLERVRRDFVANVSHELRTPLTSIKAMAETLLDGARTDESVAERFLETIIRESDRLVRLSSDLLDLSRVEAMGVNREPEDIAVLLWDVCGRLMAQGEKAGVTIINEVRPPLVAEADHDEMAQVFVNLLDNAISYTPRGGSVRLYATEAADRLTIHVADTGIGILKDDIPRLFERFYRADKARSRASGGTGLGLAIVKHIVENHGGTVSVQSEYNKGSTFSVTIMRK